MDQTCQLHHVLEKENERLEKTMCGIKTRLETKIREVEDDKREDHKELWNDLKKKVSFNLFMWIVGGLVGLYLGVSAVQTKLSYDSSQRVVSSIVSLEKSLVAVQTNQLAIKSNQDSIKIDVEAIKKYTAIK